MPLVKEIGGYRTPRRPTQFPAPIATLITYQLIN
jgi:hypothetical protein